MTNNPTQVEPEGLVERLTRAEVNAREARQLGDGDAIGLAITTLTALRTVNDGLVEAAWREGFDSARECLSDDDAFCLTADVEEDAWADSITRAALRARSKERGE